MSNTTTTTNNNSKKKVTFKVPECEIRVEPDDLAEVLRDSRINYDRRVALMNRQIGRIIEPVLSKIHRIIVWRAQHLDPELAYLSAIPPLTKAQICEMRKVTMFPRLFPRPAWYVEFKRLVSLEEDAWHIWKPCRECHPNYSSKDTSSSSEDES